jgi:hypothetical protein
MTLEGSVKGQVMPSKKRESDKKSETHQKKMVAEQKFMQPVIRTVRESATVHFYLACGHMIRCTRKTLKNRLLPRLNAGRVKKQIRMPG